MNYHDIFIAWYLCQWYNSVYFTKYQRPPSKFKMHTHLACHTHTDTHTPTHTGACTHAPPQSNHKTNIVIVYYRFIVTFISLYQRLTRNPRGSIDLPSTRDSISLPTALPPSLVTSASRWILLRA